MFGLPAARSTGSTPVVDMGMRSRAMPESKEDRGTVAGGICKRTSVIPVLCVEYRGLVLVHEPRASHEVRKLWSATTGVP